MYRLNLWPIAATPTTTMTTEKRQISRSVVFISPLFLTNYGFHNHSCAVLRAFLSSPALPVPNRGTHRLLISSKPQHFVQQLDQAAV